jgi:hypothetical protein
MREDGFEFDKWLMTTNQNFERPEDDGPVSVVSSGKLPASFLLVEAPAPTAAMQPVPDGGHNAKAPAELAMTAAMFAESKTTGYYLDKGQWMAVDPEKDKTGSVRLTFPYPTGVYNVTLLTVGENDGQSTYEVKVDDDVVGDFKCPLSTKMYEEGKDFSKSWKTIKITEGEMIGVSSTIGSADGQEYSRARWSAVMFRPADEATKIAAAPMLQQQANARPAAKSAAPAAVGSPTKASSDKVLQQPRQPDGDGTISVSGESKVWHKVTLTLNGPYAHEKDNKTNPFTDQRMTVTFTHSDGDSFVVPGYFAADGNAANSSAESGTSWRAHFAPNKAGNWNYKVSFTTGELAALNADAAATNVAPFDGKSGSLMIAASDKQGRDLRAQGRLQYVGKHYLQFAGSGKYFLKVGADAPETLLAYADFDNTVAGNPQKAPIKT